MPGLFHAFAIDLQAHPLIPPRDHAPAMHADPMRLVTFRDFLETGQGLECWCVGCQRTAATDVAMPVRNGLLTANENRARRYPAL